MTVIPILQMRKVRQASAECWGPAAAGSCAGPAPMQPVCRAHSEPTAPFCL